MTVMMIVIVEVVGEVMVIIDIVDNQYTARRVHGGRGGVRARRISGRLETSIPPRLWLGSRARSAR